MNLQQNVSKDIVAGVLIGGIFLSGILYMLSSTEDQAISLTYSNALRTEQGL